MRDASVTPPVSAERSLGAQVVGLTVARFVSVGFAFLSGVVAARLLGADGVGAAGIATILAIVAAITTNGGLPMATTYLLGTRQGNGRHLVGGLIPIAVGGALLSATLLLVVGGAVAGSVGLSGRTDLLLAAAALAAAIVLFEFAGAVLLGEGESRAFTVVEVVRGVGAFVATALILLGALRTDVGLVLAAVIAYGAAAAIAAHRIVRVLGRPSPRFDGALAGEALTIGLRGQVGSVLQFLNLRLDQLMVPFFLSVSSAGVYFIAVRLAESLSLAGSAVGALIFPQVARAADASATSITERAVRLTVVATAAGALVLGLVADPFVSIAFGPPFTDGTLALRILLVATIPLSVLRVLAGDLRGRGRPGTASIAMAIAMILGLALNATLIPAFGIEGAAMASVVSYSAGALALVVAFARITGARPSALLPRVADATRLARLFGGVVARLRRA